MLSQDCQTYPKSKTYVHQVFSNPLATTTAHSCRSTLVRNAAVTARLAAIRGACKKESR